MSDNSLFDASYQRLFGARVTIDPSAGPFFHSFYRYFLEHDEIRALFRNTDMARQEGMLRRSLFHLAAFYVSHEPSAELERIAVVHSRLGITNAHYDLWLDALVKTVREHDPKCDLATELSWRLALMPGITYMRLLNRLPKPPDQTG